MKMIKKIKMNDEKNRFESGTLKSRMKELLSITLFTIIAVLLALVLADLIFFPLTYYSVRNVDYFNILFRYAGIFCISAFMLILLFLKVRSLYRDGDTVIYKFIVAYMVLFSADLILSPIAYFFVKNILLLNVCLKITGVFFASAFLVILIFLKVRSLHRDGNTVKSIILYVLLRPLQYIGFFIFVMILISLLIMIIYFLFSSNYYHLHRIAGGA